MGHRERNIPNVQMGLVPTAHEHGFGARHGVTRAIASSTHDGGQFVALLAANDVAVETVFELSRDHHAADGLPRRIMNAALHGTKDRIVGRGRQLQRQAALGIQINDPARVQRDEPETFGLPGNGSDVACFGEQKGRYRHPQKLRPSGHSRRPHLTGPTGTKSVDAVD